MAKQDKNSDIARNIWLAGLGAYGRAFDEAVNRVKKGSKDSPKLFKDLVKRGQALEEDAREKVQQSDIVRTTSSLEERIKRVRANLSFGPIGLRDDIERLEHKIDALSRKIDGLGKANKPAPKTTARSKAKAKASSATADDK
jgi:polyhydroxyalkanoate synthesis regulator phasin